MKRLLPILLIVAVCLLIPTARPMPTDVVVVAEAPAQKAAAPVMGELNARSAIVMDFDTGEVLYAKNADTKRAPASTTKVMTLLLAAERGKMKEMVTVPSSAGKAPSGSSLVPVYPGERMPFQDLVYGLMIKSGNDAANAIGTLLSGSVASFVDDMNARAAKLGMKNTHFVNPHGFPVDGHVTTARDLAVLTRAALNNALAASIIRTKSHTMAKTSLRGELTLKNGYAILDPDSDYHYPGAFGVKTGYASASGQCFIGAASRNGRTLISVVLHAAQTKPEKWQDTAKLFDYGFAKLKAK